jgi:molybdopterin-guanine dinucleotide biosynthesis protein
MVSLTDLTASRVAVALARFQSLDLSGDLAKKVSDSVIAEAFAHARTLAIALDRADEKSEEFDEQVFAWNRESAYAITLASAMKLELNPVVEIKDYICGACGWQYKCEHSKCPLCWFPSIMSCAAP